MVVGGMTQYLAKVQGMPQAIENRLERRTQKFLWGDKNKINVNKETVYAPIRDGGRNLLDIPARNEAITIMWIQLYLRFGPDHPTWAIAADAIIAHHSPATEENVDPNLKVNVFLQTWKTSAAKLPDNLKTLMKVAKKYNVCMDRLAISKDITRQIPIWFHTKSTASRRLFNNGEQVKCLKLRHKVRMV
ncbi:hypothetical protein IW261DRAFT_1338942, partial [Armillaria novae-zelandiae]